MAAIAILWAITVLPHFAGAFLGSTFGNGLAGVNVCEGPLKIFEHTVSAGATHGVLHHFWVTGDPRVSRMWIEYYIDGEKLPSIAFQPAVMCGHAFPDMLDETSLYSAGTLCGKNAAVGGWFNTYPVPFGRSILAIARTQPGDGCYGAYLNVRGTENMAVILPGGLQLPPSSRLFLQKNLWATRNPLEYITVAELPPGQAGMVFQATLGVEARPVGGQSEGGGYIEGCWQFYGTNKTAFPGLVVGTGVEDYFDSAYYFGVDTDLGRALPYATPLAGLPYFARTDDGFERLSTYRFHAQDPLVFTDGGSLVWRVGAEASGPGQTKCGSSGTVFNLAHKPAERRLRELSPINVTTYGWVYTWASDNDEDVIV